MGSIAVGERNKMLQAWCGNATYTANAAVWVKLHLGDPGSAGTSSPAANTTRKVATFAAAASGAITNNAELDWPTVSTSESYTYISCWTASSGGTFIGSDQLPTTAVMSAGDDFTIPVGDLDISVT